MKKEKKNKQGLKRIFRNNFRLLAKIARLTPDFFIAVILQGIVWGGVNSAEAIFTVRLFDALDAGATFAEAAQIILFMAAFYLVTHTVNAWYWQYYNAVLGKKLDMRLHRELFEKAKTLDVACYDDPEFYNDFVWAMDEASTRSWEVLNDVGQILSRLVAASTLMTLLLSIDKIIAVVIFAVSVIKIFIDQIMNKLWFEQEKAFKPLYRVSDYLNRIFRLQDHAKEIRTSGMSEVLMDRMDENIDSIQKTTVKYGKKMFVINSVSRAISQITYTGAMIYMFIRLLNGDVMIGGFTAAVGMIWRLRWMIINFVERMMKFSKHSLFLEKYFGFLSYEPKIKGGEKIADDFESLVLRNVSFSYDFSDKPRYEFAEKNNEKSDDKVKEGPSLSLENVDLTIRRGEKIALVGYNGAGKTTLTKLLLRLYDPSEGEVLYNGTDLREYDLTSYREKIGCVFQDYKIFALTIAENVRNGEYDSERDKDKVLSALGAAGFSEKLCELEKGLDTSLTREFDDNGTELSGGESQKVAIARAFARDYELIIMDEPSSALDPIAEYELNHAILDYGKDKTVVFISHRLSTTRMADRIYMFDSGRLIEQGSHEELMALGGKYAEMFTLQAQKYRA